MHVRDQHAQPDARIGQHFVQPILLRCQHAAELLALPRDQPQMANVRLGNERATQQSGARQGGQPLRVGYIGLATGHILDMPRVDHPRGNAHRLQRSVRALPVDARALHHHHLGAKLTRPLRQRFAVALERSKLALLNRHRAIRLLRQGAGADLGLVHVQSNHPLVHGLQFHGVSPFNTQ